MIVEITILNWKQIYSMKSMHARDGCNSDKTNFKDKLWKQRYLLFQQPTPNPTESRTESQQP